MEEISFRDKFTYVHLNLLITNTFTWIYLCRSKKTYSTITIHWLFGCCRNLIGIRLFQWIYIISYNRIFIVVSRSTPPPNSRRSGGDGPDEMESKPVVRLVAVNRSAVDRPPKPVLGTRTSHSFVLALFFTSVFFLFLCSLFLYLRLCPGRSLHSEGIHEFLIQYLL